MKNVLMVPLLVLATASVSNAQPNCAAKKAEQVEREQIMLHLSSFLNNIAGDYPLSKAYRVMLTSKLLLCIGTPVAHKMYKEMIKSGQIRTVFIKSKFETIYYYAGRKCSDIKM
jgi:hypothetical protein